MRVLVTQIAFEIAKSIRLDALLESVVIRQAHFSAPILHRVSRESLSFPSTLPDQNQRGDNDPVRRFTIPRRSKSRRSC